MRAVLVIVALVVSLWPVFVVVLAVDRVLGGGGDKQVAAVTSPAQTGPTPAPPTQPAPATGAPTPGWLDLGGLNRLRDDTAGLIVAVKDSSSVSAGQPDAQLAADALDVEAAIVAWQEVNAGLGGDAEYFAALFLEIAAATADFATAPSVGAKARLEQAITRHRRETLQGGG